MQEKTQQSALGGVGLADFSQAKLLQFARDLSY
jgi:hypothetical protein